MNRRQKLGLAALAALAAVSFTLPFLLRQNPLPRNPPGGGGGTNPGGGTTTPPTENGTHPPAQEPHPGHAWSGWRGLCHGEGHHYGIVKKLSALNRTATCA